MAGGRGTRARPYTDYIPKAMIPVAGRPLIDHILDYVAASDTIDGTVVVADFEGVGGQMRNYLEGDRRRGGVVLAQDSSSGTGGDLLHAEPHLGGSGEFLLWFVDNLCAPDIPGMAAHYRRMGSLACIATRTRRREETGFAEVRNGAVIRFAEKPVVELPMAECLGLYILSTGVLRMIREVGGSVNLSYDILQGMARQGSVSAYDIGTDWMDVSSPAHLERNRALADSIVERMASAG